MNVTQSAVAKAEFCCKAKLVEGTSHDNVSLLLARSTFNCGVGVVRPIQIPPPPAAATNSEPSAEEATELHPKAGALLLTQVTPESLEV